MRLRFVLFNLLVSAAAVLSAQVPASVKAAEATIDAEKIRAHVRFLADDLLEGRGPGLRGSELAAKYIATEFALDGLMPAGDAGTYFQQVKFFGMTVKAGRLDDGACAGAGHARLPWRLGRITSSTIRGICPWSTSTRRSSLWAMA